MKICVAQTRPVPGDIPANIDDHKEVIDLAVLHGADTIIFPELSLTGYEPNLAAELATDPDDARFADFQKIADGQQVIVGVGVPTRSDAGIRISMIVFEPHRTRLTYSKQYLHPDEETFFVDGSGSVGLIEGRPRIAPAICYELSVPEHAENAFKCGAEVYVASVAKFRSGIEKARERLSAIAAHYSMVVLMVNCVGTSDGQECAGGSSAWNKTGSLVGQLDDTSRGLLIVDTETPAAIRTVIRH